MKHKVRYILVAVLLCVACATTWAAASVKVGVLLPLKERSERGRTLVEFYQGLLMAVEQVKTEGVSVDVYAMDCGSSETQLQHLLKTQALSNMDVIFGPVDAVQVPSLSEFCRQHRIRMVLPFNTPCSQIYSNPWIYQVGVAQELLYPGITNLIIENLGSANFVVCHTGEADDRGASFVDHISQVLKLRGLHTSVLNIFADEFAYDRALNQYKQNVVIPDSRSQTAITKVLTGIKAYQQTHPQYRVSLLGYPEWLTYTKTLLKEFYAYDTYVYSAYYRNPLLAKTAKFEQQYQQNFSHPSRISYPRAEMLGYDLGLYFLHGLSMLGDEFDERQSEISQQPVQHMFNFQRVGEQCGFVNLNVQLVHYNVNKTIQVVR